MKSKTVVAVFDDVGVAQEVAQDLTKQGVPQNDIHISTEPRQIDTEVPEEHRHGFIAWLENLFGGDDSEQASKRYKEAVNKGKVVVAVETDDTNQDDVVDLLEQRGAVNVEETGDAEPATDKATGETHSIPVVKEDVKVGKQTVLRGGVRVYSHVVEEPVEEQIPLREERVRVERRQVDRPVSGSSGDELRDQTIEVTEAAEQPVVTKQPRVVEEVVITKEVTERSEPIHETARRTEIKVEPLSAGVSHMPSECVADFRKNYDQQYASAGGTYSDYLPAYEYGYRMATENRGKSFETLESQLKTDYLRSHPNSVWDKMRGAVRYGWERGTGQR